MSFRLVEMQGLKVLLSPLFEQAGVFHAFTTRSGGVSQGVYSGLNLRKQCGDEYENVVKNYSLIADALGFRTADIAMSKQVHGNAVRRIDGGEGLYADRPDCDALVSDTDAVMMVFAADCVPILLYDTRTRAAAAVHAGWRGTVAGCPAAAVRRMSDEFGTNPADIIAAIGPCIERNCYEVGSDVENAIDEVFGVRDNHPDLRYLNALALERAGVPSSSIDIDDRCTKCETDLFWSHRRTGDARGVQGALVRAGASV